MPIPLIILAVAIGVGGAAYGCDQNNKRVREQEGFRSYRKSTDQKVKDLEERLGEKNRQVRELSEELLRQRRKSA